jgi:hypothetical protein
MKKYIAFATLVIVAMLVLFPPAESVLDGFTTDRGLVWIGSTGGWIHIRFLQLALELASASMFGLAFMSLYRKSK